MIMKKLLILMLVLGLTSAASATIVGAGLEVDNVNPIYPGDVVTISLRADAEATGFGITTLTDDASPMGTAAVGTIYPGFNFGLNDGTAYLVNSGNVLFDRADGSSIAGSHFSLLPGGSNCPAQTALYTFDYTVDATLAAPTTINIGISGASVIKVGGATYASVEGTSFDVVPEPMTIVLLGLGGLFLRRRR
jgi:hypothetical protein